MLAEAVVLSMKTGPLRTELKAPLGPSVTPRRSLSLPTQQNTKSWSLAASAGVGAVLPPYSFAQASAFAPLRLETVGSCPPFCLPPGSSCRAAGVVRGEVVSARLANTPRHRVPHAPQADPRHLRHVALL